MLQKARNNTSDIGLLDAKYTIDKFHNPYLSKFTFKLTPSTVNYNQTKIPFHILSPFDPSNNLYISQSLPIFKSQKFRASLVWKQSMRKKMGRGFIGLSTQYKAENMWSLRSRAMFGSVFLYNLQAIKKINYDTEVMLYHHGMYDNKVIAPIFGIGGRKRQFSATFHRRLGLDYNAVLQYTKPLRHGFYIYARNQLTVGQKFEPQSKAFVTTLSLDYYFDQSIRARVGVVHHLEENQVRPVFEVQKTLENWGNFALNMEYRNNASILSISYKNPTLNLILPVLLIDSPIPVIVSSVIYALGYLFRKKSAPILQTKKKQDDIRISELKLISDKANAIYDKEHSAGENGLLIDWAFVGPEALINQLQATPQNRRPALLRNPQFKENVFDVTVSLRFYVIKGELKLKKGDKNHLLGFYCKNSDDHVFMKYQKGGQQKELRFKMMDDLLIN